MLVQPYLFFEGRCEEALEFYRRALGAGLVCDAARSSLAGSTLGALLDAAGDARGRRLALGGLPAVSVSENRSVDGTHVRFTQPINDPGSGGSYPIYNLNNSRDSAYPGADRPHSLAVTRASAASCLQRKASRVVANSSTTVR